MNVYTFVFHRTVEVRLVASSLKVSAKFQRCQTLNRSDSHQGKDDLASKVRGVTGVYVNTVEEEVFRSLKVGIAHCEYAPLQVKASLSMVCNI